MSKSCSKYVQYVFLLVKCHISVLTCMDRNPDDHSWKVNGDGPSQLQSQEADWAPLPPLLSHVQSPSQVSSAVEKGRQGPCGFDKSPDCGRGTTLVGKWAQGCPRTGRLRRRLGAENVSCWVDLERPWAPCRVFHLQGRAAHAGSVFREFKRLL